ncbi:hypothetical protein [Actinokineospora sp. NPDC004072]
MITAGVLSVPLFVAAAGVAAADDGAARPASATFAQSSAVADASGASRQLTASGVDELGNTYFYEVLLVAGPDGAGSISTTALATPTSALFHQHHTHAGPQGANSFQTSSGAGG